MRVTGALCSHHGRIYIHELPALFTVGQTFPTAEVPTPRSHKAYEYANNFAQVRCAIDMSSALRR